MRGMEGGIAPSALGLHKGLGLTLAKGGGGRHATPAVSPFVYVSLVSVVQGEGRAPESLAVFSAGNCLSFGRKLRV